MRFRALTAAAAAFLLVAGFSGPVAAQTCLISVLCARRPLPSPSPVPPPPAPALPPTAPVTDPATDVIDSAGGALKTPVAVLEGQMLNLINAERATAGLHALAMSSWAQSFARSFSEKMMAAGTIWHNPDYFARGRAAMGADLLSENVGYDSSIPANHVGFMRSPSHRANILDGRLTHVGIGVAVSPAGRVYVTEDFARIPGGGSGRPGSGPPAAGSKLVRTVAGVAPAADMSPGAGAQNPDAQPETITLGRSAPGTSAHTGPDSPVWQRTAGSQSPAPMIPGLVAGGLLAALAPMLILGKSLFPTPGR